jgi:hypothetical protein
MLAVPQPDFPDAGGRTGQAAGPDRAPNPPPPPDRGIAAACRHRPRTTTRNALFTTVEHLPPGRVPAALERLA